MCGCNWECHSKVPGDQQASEKHHWSTQHITITTYAKAHIKEKVRNPASRVILRINTDSKKQSYQTRMICSYSNIKGD